MNYIAKPYVYKLTHKITGQFYYGYRYKNLRHNRLAIDDLGIHYKTSSKYIKEIGFDNFYFEIIGEYDKPDAAYWAEQSLIKESWGNALLLNKKYQDKDSFKEVFAHTTPHTLIAKQKMSNNHWDCSGDKNPFWGKGETQSGDKNPRFDETIYHWVHKDGREEFLTQYDMRVKYDLESVGRLIRSRFKSSKGWRITKSYFKLPPLRILKKQAKVC